MSAPDTNVDRQKRRHAGPLVGMAVVVIFALALLFGLYVWLTAEAEEPAAEVEILAPSVTAPSE